MIRNLKALGLALIAFAAFGAISASGASAETVTEEQAKKHFFTCATYPCKLTGTQDEPHKFTLGGTLSCPKTHFKGELTAKSSEPKMFPEVEGTCTTTVFGSEFSTTVTFNGCWYKFTVHEKGTDPGTAEETKTSAANSTPVTEGVTTHYWHGELHLECPAGVKGIEIHVFNDGAPHLNLRCTYTVKPQTIGKIDYNLQTFNPTKLKVNPTTPKVKVTRTSGSLLQCGAENQEAEYHGPTTVTATNSLGEPISGGIE